MEHVGVNEEQRNASGEFGGWDWGEEDTLDRIWFEK